MKEEGRWSMFVALLAVLIVQERQELVFIGCQQETMKNTRNGYEERSGNHQSTQEFVSGKINILCTGIIIIITMYCRKTSPTL